MSDLMMIMRPDSTEELLPMEQAEPLIFMWCLLLELCCSWRWKRVSLVQGGSGRHAVPVTRQGMKHPLGGPAVCDDFDGDGMPLAGRPHFA